MPCCFPEDRHPRHETTDAVRDPRHLLPERSLTARGADGAFDAASISSGSGPGGLHLGREFVARRGDRRPVPVCPSARQRLRRTRFSGVPPEPSGPVGVMLIFMIRDTHSRTVAATPIANPPASRGPRHWYDFGCIPRGPREFSRQSRAAVHRQLQHDTGVDSGELPSSMS